MAHSFAITYEGKKNGNPAFERAYFFGFCNGIMYEVFEMQHHYAGASGDGCIEEVTLDNAKSSLDLAIDYFDNWSNYPDPSRMNDIKNFRKYLDELKDQDKGKISIFFG